MLGAFFGKLSFWSFLDFFTRQIKKSHKIPIDGAQNCHHYLFLTFGHNQWRQSGFKGGGACTK